MANPEKTEELQNIFNELDKDSDGFLTLEEAKQMLESLGDLETQLNLEQLLQELGLDSDSDLKINFQEFLNIYSKSQEGGTLEEPQLLEEAENNGEEFLDSEEAPKIIEPPVQAEQPIEAETLTDTNNGESTKEEVDEGPKVSVGGAKNFFETKMQEQKTSTMEDEKKKIQDEARRKKFQQKLAFFSQSQQS